ncbi:MAG: SgcJ/EcaC family oxidoreductase [Verrucomicrobiota bacterium]|jgi:uncharacterized protein (TIGR02246 family)
MKQHVILTACLALVLYAPVLYADEPTPDIAGLHKAASDFVDAYNKKDAAAIAKLFTVDGELTDLSGEEITSSRAEIEAHYSDVLADENASSIAIEVSSVRLVTPDIAIEDGRAHFTPPGKGTIPRSIAYTAVLAKNAEGAWLIASSRTLRDVTDAAGQLAALSAALIGEWTSTTADGVRLDLAIGWDVSEKFLSGEMLTTTADAEPQTGTIRIGWNAAKNSIVSWMFDSEGGVIEGVWTPSETGWLIRAEGTTADGETFSAMQKITPEGEDVIQWDASQRVIAGAKQPANKMRLVRQPPEAAETN